MHPDNTDCSPTSLCSSLAASMPLENLFAEQASYAHICWSYNVPLLHADDEHLVKLTVRVRA